MSEHLPYELIIAEKLQQLPPPDMADAIWARIERQLDIDMPTDDGGNAPTTPPGNDWVGGAVLGVFVAAFVIIFLLFQKEEPASPQAQPQQHIPATQLPVGPAGDTPRSAPPGTETRSPARKAAPLPNVVAPEVEFRDSAAVIVPPALPDSVAPARTVTTPQQQPAQDSVKPRRGVSGISDSSYRIVPR